MNASYDIDKARKLLESLRREQLGTLTGLDKNIPMLADLKIEDTFIVETEKPPYMRLSVQEGQYAMDVVVRVHAVLGGKSLGPYTSQPCQPTQLNRIRNLRQHVQLTALESVDVEEDFKKLGAIETLFRDYAFGKKVVPFDFLPYEGWPCIESHARYFTERALAPNDKNQAFKVNVDPHKILSKLQPKEFIHGSDNAVEYSKKVVGANGGITHEAVSPGLFKAGDIVEVTFSIIGIPIKENRVLVLLLLRGVMLLDDSESERPSQGHRSVTVIHHTPKRRLYLDHAPETSPQKKARVPDDLDVVARNIDSVGCDTLGDEKVHIVKDNAVTAGDIEGEQVEKKAGVGEAGAVSGRALAKRKLTDESDGYDTDTELGQIFEDHATLKEKEGGEGTESSENEVEGMQVD